jgi:hypothetical protein
MQTPDDKPADQGGDRPARPDTQPGGKTQQWANQVGYRPNIVALSGRRGR